MNRSILYTFLIFLFTTAIYPQYFGRNKVQYEDFDFKKIQTEHFEIYFYPKTSEAVFDATRMLERWEQRLSRVFKASVGSNQPIILYANHADFQQTNVISGLISQATGGVTEGLKNRVVIPLTGVYSENDHVLGHELVHAFQYNVIKRDAGGLQSAAQVPLWFIEGLAEYLSIGRSDASTAMWMRDAILFDDLPTIDEVSNSSEYFPYRYGHAIWAYIADRWGDDLISNLFTSVLKQGWENGFKQILNVSLDSLSKGWQATLKDLYVPQLEGKTHPKDLGKKIIGEENQINLSPTISPDGKYIALLSQQDIFSIDLYLIDAKTGEVIDELVSSNTDRHFDALRFINSSGAWSPDSKRFAFVIQENGDGEIAILDVNSREVRGRIMIDQAESITNIAWSPDGNSIVFSGTYGSISNLYLYDFNTETTTKLMDDKYADIQPAWSPDGKTIAFVTDRGENTDFTELKYSTANIGFLNLDTREISVFSLGDNIKHINPAYSPDGTSLYFISNPDGFNDIYRLELKSRKLYRLTNCATGISGLTELSPAMSVSSGTGQIVFNVFQQGDYYVHSTGQQNTFGEPVQPQNMEFYIHTALIPPSELDEGIVQDYIEDKDYGLIDKKTFSYSDYSPSLSLLNVSQGYVGVGTNRFGTTLGGGVSFLFSDLLGNHMLGAVLQANGSFQDIGGQVVYRNLDSRWNWGGAIAHIPYLTGYARSNVGTVNGNPVREIEIIRQRVFSDAAVFLTEYPISTNRRWEFGAGYNRISYSVESEKLVTTPDGFIVGRSEESLDAPSALNLFQANVAYVGDYSFFGFTSPVNGRRYRLEVEPTVGTLQFMSALLDYREYLFLDPFTFAFRFFHYGRYLGDSDNDRLTPLYLGYETWVRGYSVNDISVDECSETDNPEDCPEFDRLVGSRVGVFNAEFRIPLFGVEQFGLINFPYLPTEISAFFDGGVAWTKETDPVLEFKRHSNERIPVFSAGAAARVNVLGYIVVQFFYAYPFQRPGQGWDFGFVIAPGW